MATSILTYLQPNFQYNPFGLFYMAGAGISLSVGLLVLLHNPFNKTNISFFLISLFGCNWQFSYGMVLMVISEEMRQRGTNK